MIMKKISIIAGMIALAGLFTGCVKEDIAQETTEVKQEQEVKLVKIRLSTNAKPEILEDSDTKTMLTSDLNVHWQEGDKIKIGFESWGQHLGMMTNISMTGKNATFEGTIPSEILTNKTVSVIYPYQEPTTIKSGQSGMSNVMVPYKQTLSPGTFDPNANISIATIDMTSDQALHFKNVTGLLEFRLKGTEKIRKVEIKTPNLGHELGAVSSQAAIDNGNGFEVTYERDDYGLIKTISNINYPSAAQTSRTITLTSENDIQLTDMAQKFYAAVMPYGDAKTIDGNNDYIVSVTREDGSVFEETVNLGDKGVRSGKITRMGEFTVNANPPVPGTVYVTWTGTYTANSPRFAAYFWDKADNYAWVDGDIVAVGDWGAQVYSYATPGPEYENVIFYIMDPTTTENNDTNSLKKSSELVIPRRGDTSYTWTIGESWGNMTYTESDFTPLTKLYYKPMDNFISDDGRFAAYFFNDAKGINKWIDLTDEGDGTYSVDIPGAGYVYLYFAKLKADTADIIHKTDNLAVQANGNDMWVGNSTAWFAIGSWQKK